jgi:hypothetical protein
MNANTIRNLLKQKAGKLPKTRSNEELQSLAEFLEQPDTADYLQHCVLDDVIAASGVRLLPINAIEQEMAEGAAPGSFIRPFGYLIVATSIGGNTVCIHSPTGKYSGQTTPAFRTIPYLIRTTRQANGNTCMNTLRRMWKKL